MANALAGTKLTLSGSTAGVVVTQAEDPDAATRLAMAVGGATGNAVGSVQADELKALTHTHIQYAQTTGTVSTAIPPQGNLNVPQYGTTSATGGNESRPKNAYVNYIIKF